MKDQKYYVEKLNQVYEKHYSDNGICPFFDKCSQNMEDAKIKCDYATRVGKEYGKQRIRVLVIGKEGKNYHASHESPAPFPEVQNPHYKGTLYTLALILEGKEPNGLDVKDLLDYKSLINCFCLTNYYKCAFSKKKNNSSGLKSSNSMKQNCHSILMDEIRTLEPDLIVVQGKFTTKPFWNAMDSEYGIGEKIFQENGTSLYRHKMNGIPFYIIYSYHPAARNNVWMKHLNSLKKAIRIFREKHNSKAE